MSSKPVIIALMGPTGSGKSNFINQLTGRKEDNSAHGLKSDTQGIREFTVNLSNNRLYVFVDTPGFDDTYRSDRDILRTIAEWLEKKYRNEVKLTGIIYTHRITDNRMSGSVCKNLDMFSRLCGDKAAERVRLVTTMWDKAKDKNLAKSRVSQLETNFWEPLLEAGARHEQFENSSDSAWKIVRGLMGEGEAVLLQEELVDVERKLNETTAGKALYSQFQKLLHEQKETIKQLQEEAKAQKDPELVKQLEAEQRRLEAELQKTWDDMDKLKIPFFRRLALLFSKKPQSRKIELSLPGN
ncbi:P-loop containing nucleoside triphosphate hydrolase protein [Pisolithus orientalis]|uniref:P-loop containing nucleoside triphosphate hydrolase protein n=1 Tax=Pisolithus orientalis TaxID=936130 RepID=UPI0022251698|nr:P-loop containing nucleoside triphosphate hydrolase protein [Pisolithus orientalis]KAI5997317.1 P-loop containing nucleoside triphosphate hydrolase protein [Pisolithus orientalis]